MKRYTQEQRSAILASWQHSNLSKVQFCEKRNISITTFYKWLNSLKKENSSPAIENSPHEQIQFIEVEQPKATKKQVSQAKKKLVIISSDGMRVELEL